MRENESQGQSSSRPTGAVVRNIKVLLSKFKLKPEIYCHREEAELTKEQVRPFMEVIKSDGMQIPVEGYWEDGYFVLIKGYRRISALLLGAEEGIDGFSMDMLVDAIEVTGAKSEDLLIWSVGDNEQRKQLSPRARLGVAKKFYTAGVPAERAAAALNVSLQQYRHDLTIAMHAWMMAYVLCDFVGHTHMWRLAEAAEKAERLDELKKCLDALFAQQDADLDKAEKKAVFDRWVRLLEAGEPLSSDFDAPDLKVEVGTDHLRIGRFKLDYRKVRPEDLTKFGTDVSKALGSMAKFIKVANVLNDLNDTSESQLASDFLRQVGATDSDDLRAGLNQNAVAAGDGLPENGGHELEQHEPADQAESAAQSTEANEQAASTEAAQVEPFTPTPAPAPTQAATPLSASGHDVAPSAASAKPVPTPSSKAQSNQSRQRRN